MSDYVAILVNIAFNHSKNPYVNPLDRTADHLAGAAAHIKRLESENASLRRERDDALRAAEARRVRQEIEGEHS